MFWIHPRSDGFSMKIRGFWEMYRGNHLRVVFCSVHLVLDGVEEIE